MPSWHGIFITLVAALSLEFWRFPWLVRVQNLQSTILLGCLAVPFHACGNNSVLAYKH
jgi:hypothetical protein